MQTFFEWLETVEKFDVARKIVRLKKVKIAMGYIKNKYYRNNPKFTERIEGNLNAMRELLGMPMTKGEQYSTKYLHQIIDGMVEILKSEPIPDGFSGLTERLIKIFTREALYMPRAPEVELPAALNWPLRVG